MFLRVIVAAGVLGGLIGCASLTSFQDARTIEKGTGRAHVAFNMYTETNEKDEGDLDKIDDEGFMLQLGGRFGLTDKIDMGITYIVPGSVLLDGKYQFTAPTSVLGVSSGLKLGYLSYSYGSENNMDTVMALDVIVPVYASYYPVSWIAVTLNPDVVSRIRLKGPKTDPYILIGGNASLKLGKNIGVVAEAGYHVQPGEDRVFTTYGGSFYTPLDLSNFLGMFGL